MKPFQVVMWIDICVCLPLTILFIGWVCCAGQRKKFPIAYYIYLLISNVTRICAPLVWVTTWETPQITIFSEVLFFFGVLASLYFKMCIALERYFFVACPLLVNIRQTKVSVLVCLLVWAFCISTASCSILLDQHERMLIFTIFTAPLIIFCLAGTLKALPAATSLPAEEKRRIVGTLVLLLLNCFLFILPEMILLTFHPHPLVRSISLNLILLSPLVDLILFFLVRKGPTDRSCCSVGNAAADASSS